MTQSSSGGHHGAVPDPASGLYRSISRRNERIYLAYRVMSTAIVDRAIFVIFLMHKGFTPYQIGILQAAFFLANILTEVPAGLYGDAFGRKRSVLLGLMAYCCYALGVIVADGFLSFLALYALLGVALALVYGSDTALIYDSLVLDQRSDDFNGLQMKANALGLISGALAVLAGGLLQTISWEAVYFAYFVVYAIALLVWTFAIEPPAAETPQGKSAVARELLSFTRTNLRTLGLPILGFVVLVACTTPFFTFSQALFSANDISVQHITWFFCAAQLLIGLVYVLWKKVTLGFYVVVSASSLLTTVALALMYFNVVAIDFAAFFLVMMISPVVGAVTNDHFNQRLPSRVRASFLSLVGLCMSLAIAVTYAGYSLLTEYLPLHQVIACTSLLSLCALLIFITAWWAEQHRSETMLSRLFFRETPFKRLSRAELRTLHNAFRATLDANSQAFYWVHRLDDERLLVTDFFHASMLRYRGLEVVLIEGESISYYRLPGAKVGGTGQVPPGDYAVRITAPSGAGFLLDIRKNHLGRFEVQALAPSPADAAPATHVELARHDLEPSKFADELKAAVASTVELTYRSYRSAAASRQTSLAEQLRSAPWLRAVLGTCPETDAYLWMLNQPITEPFGKGRP